MAAHRSDPLDAWDRLEEPWRVCLSLTWEAYAANTIPVGAALADASGAIIATGRNRVYERVAPPGQLCNSLLAHAEVNALVALDPERHYEDHVLYTALEPCALCVGAAAMATVGRIRYAGPDPYGGGDGKLAMSNVHLQRVQLTFDGPRSDWLGRFASALIPAFYLRRKPDGKVVDAFRERAPATLALAERLLAADAEGLASSGVSAADALSRLWPALSYEDG